MIICRELNSLAVYAIPQCELFGPVAGNIAERINELGGRSRVVIFEDLINSDIYLSISPLLPSYLVLDQLTPSLLKSLGVRGIRTPFHTKPGDAGLTGLPLYGNLSNPTWAAVKVGGSCNSHCVFCYTDWIRSVTDLTISEIKDAIARISYIHSVHTLIISGGEATLRRDIVDIFKYAKSFNFSLITLQTNGCELKDPALVIQLAESGLGHVLLSLHGPDEMTHDAITQKRGSFSDAINGLQNLTVNKIPVTFNTVICRSNFEKLPSIASLAGDLLGKHGRLRLSYTIVEGAAYDNVYDILVRFSDIKPFLLKTIEVAATKSLELQLANMPQCIYYEYLDCLLVTTEQDSLSDLIEASPFYKHNVARGEGSIKFQSCRNCRLNEACRGIQIEYIRRFTDSHNEFKPIIN